MIVHVLFVFFFSISSLVFCEIAFALEASSLLKWGFSFGNCSEADY